MPALWSDVKRVVEAQVGFREVPKGSNRGPQVDLYTGNRAEPWCGHFVAWAFRSVGHPLPGDIAPSPTRANPLASVSHTERVFAEHGWMHREPREGDLVFYATRGMSDPGRGRHIGIVVGVTPTHIETVEGNWGDAVVRRRVLRTSAQITGYGRPSYAG
jgi:hypothetical protein